MRKEVTFSLVILLSVFVYIDGANFARPCHSRARTPRHGSAVLIDHDNQVLGTIHKQRHANIYIC